MDISEHSPSLPGMAIQSDVLPAARQLLKLAARDRALAREAQPVAALVVGKPEPVLDRVQARGELVTVTAPTPLAAVVLEVDAVNLGAGDHDVLDREPRGLRGRRTIAPPSFSITTGHD